MMLNKYDSVIRKLGGKFDEPRAVPIPESQLASYERYLGFKLPADYREFIRDYAGVVVNAVFRREDEYGSEVCSGRLDIFYGVPDFKEGEVVQRSNSSARFELEYAPGMTQVLDLDEDATEIDDPPCELLPIAIDPGGNQIYLALAGLRPGGVFLWKNWADIFLIADSFHEFINMLKPR